MQMHPLGVLWRRLAFIYFLFIYFIYFYILFFFTNIRREVILLIARVTSAFRLLFGRHNMLFIIIKIFHWGLFCARLNSVYLCPELLGVIYSKWDHLCPRYLGVIFSPERDHLCPRDLGKMFFTQVGLSVPERFREDVFHPSETICGREI